MFKLIFAILFVIVNILDWYLTKRIINKGGRELNPILKRFGVAKMKLIICPILILAGYLLHWAVLVVPTLIILGACIWNYRILKRMERA
jgi:hypothetical protein